MDCPVCESPMKEIERYGGDIEICPECKGVWRMLNYLNVCEIGIHFKSEGKNNSHREHRDHRGFLLCVLCALCGR